MRRIWVQEMFGRAKFVSSCDSDFLSLLVLQLHSLRFGSPFVVESAVHGLSCAIVSTFVLESAVPKLYR